MKTFFHRFYGYASVVAAVLLTALVGCTQSSPSERFTAEELALVRGRAATMRVYTVGNPSDSLVLRTSCKDIAHEDLISGDFRQLSQRMVSTVTSPEQGGVGIAGPQIGLSRRIVAVQRFDKPGKPFEVYPNIRIIATRGEQVDGREGCLSVPGQRGVVRRWQDIGIAYVSPYTLADTTEQVQGYTAVIFQHECDHLDGILYIDKSETSNIDNMEQVYHFLRNCGKYYLATAEGEQPRVRPFGTVNIFENKLYIQTGKVKNVAHQIAANSKVEICAFNGSEWIRVAATLVEDDCREARASMLDAYPELRSMYNEDDGNTVVYYLKDATAIISSFTAPAQTITF